MQIQSSRFGPLSVDPDQVTNFPRGLIGFTEHHRFVFVPDPTNEHFSWLQSADDAEVAFLLTDPSFFFKGYAVAIKEEIAQELQLEACGSCGTAAPGCEHANKAVHLFVICNKVGDWLTGNLLGPIVINPNNFLATQVVLTEKKWTTRQPLAKLQSESRLAKAA